MYLGISLGLAAICAVAFANYFNVVAVLLIAFVGCICILTFCDTLITKSNFAFSKGLETTGDCMDNGGIGVFGVPMAFAFAILGGILLAPVWYYTAHIKAKASKYAMMGSLLAGLAFLMIIGIIIIADPILLYRYIHYGWIAWGSVLFLLVLIGGVIVFQMQDMAPEYFTPLWGCAAFVVSLIVCFGMIGTSWNETYKIDDPQDMNIMVNAPINSSVEIIVENDIDFTGVDVSNWFGGEEPFLGIIDGQGYTFSNIHIKTSESRSYSEFGFVSYNGGQISNLNFRGCQITICSAQSYGNYGIIAGYHNYGTYNCQIINCNVIDCQLKYALKSGDSSEQVNASLTVGKSSYSPAVKAKAYYTKPQDETFYQEGGISWIKVSLPEEEN